MAGGASRAMRAVVPDRENLADIASANSAVPVCVVLDVNCGVVIARWSGGIEGRAALECWNVWWTDGGQEGRAGGDSDWQALAGACGRLSLSDTLTALSTIDPF